MNKLVFAPFSLFLFSTAAAAADFTGPRGEVRVGWDHPTVSAHVGDEKLLSESASGISYGAELGYDHAFSGGLVGAYAGFDLSTAKICGDDFDEEDCLKTRRNITVGLRAGILASPASLLYVKGGYSNGRFGVDSQDDEHSESRSRGGFHLGAGAEFALGSGAYIRGEYVYTRYNSVVDEDEPSLRVRPSRHQILAGVGFRF